MKITKEQVKLIVYLIIIIIGAQALTIEQTEKIHRWSQECKVYSGITMDMVYRIRGGEDVDTPEVRKQVLCVAKKAGLITEDEELNVKVLKSKLRNVIMDETRVHQVVTKCMMKKSTAGEFVLKGFKCLHKEEPLFTYA